MKSEIGYLQKEKPIRQAFISVEVVDPIIGKQRIKNKIDNKKTNLIWKLIFFSPHTHKKTHLNCH